MCVSVDYVCHKAIIENLASLLESEQDAILAANEKDLQAAKEGPPLVLCFIPRL